MIVCVGNLGPDKVAGDLQGRYSASGNYKTRVMLDLSDIHGLYDGISCV